MVEINVGVRVDSNVSDVSNAGDTFIDIRGDDWAPNHMIEQYKQ